MNVTCFGDSNTYGYDPRSFLGGRYDPDHRWVDILAAETGWTVYNMGQNGREIPTALPSIPSDTDLLILMLGTNDLLQGLSPEMAAAKLERFLHKIPFSLNRYCSSPRRPWPWENGCPTSNSLTTPTPLPKTVRHWPSDLVFPLPTPETGTFPWLMTAFILLRKATEPLPLDF